MKKLVNIGNTLADKACEAIREAIVTLKFKPGQFIYETQIANMLGVSRTPIREAIKQLKMREMVEISPSKGYFNCADINEKSRRSAFYKEKS